jgi:hypothetical protein
MVGISEPIHETFNKFIKELKYYDSYRPIFDQYYGYDSPANVRLSITSNGITTYYGIWRKNLHYNLSQIEGIYQFKTTKDIIEMSDLDGILTWFNNQITEKTNIKIIGFYRPITRESSFNMTRMEQDLFGLIE